MSELLSWCQLADNALYLVNYCEDSWTKGGRESHHPIPPPARSKAACYWALRTTAVGSHWFQSWRTLAWMICYRFQHCGTCYSAISFNPRPSGGVGSARFFVNNVRSDIGNDAKLGILFRTSIWRSCTKFWNFFMITFLNFTDFIDRMSRNFWSKIDKCLKNHQK